MESQRQARAELVQQVALDGLMLVERVAVAASGQQFACCRYRSQARKLVGSFA